MGVDEMEVLYKLVEAGILGAVLLVILWKMLPGMLSTFKEEIQKERDLAIKLIEAERKHSKELVTIMTNQVHEDLKEVKNAVDSLTAAVNDNTSALRSHNSEHHSN